MSELHSARLVLRLATIILAGCSLLSPAVAQDQAFEPTRVVLASEVQWQQLNPARGDKSPQAATLWGDRNGKVGTGFLVKFVDGFSSPPHIHNVTYRGIVIHGLVHNDDPEAAPMWMPKGSFWTQPAGEPHITSARGSTIAFIEIETGPYLVMAIDEAFDRGERPVNIDASNLVWLDAADSSWITPSKKANKQEISFLWRTAGGERQQGTLIRLPAGFSGTISVDGSDFKAVVITGEMDLARKQANTVTLEPGSYFHSRGNATHQLSCAASGGCLLYVRSVGRFTVSGMPQ